MANLGTETLDVTGLPGREALLQSLEQQTASAHQAGTALERPKECLRNCLHSPHGLKSGPIAFRRQTLASAWVSATSLTKLRR